MRRALLAVAVLWFVFEATIDIYSGYSHTFFSIADNSPTLILLSNVPGFVHDNRDDINAISTLVIACFTIALAVVSYFQWRALRDEFLFNHRPWVVVDRIIPASDLDLKSGLSFTFFVKNVGNSPGMNVDVSAVMHLPHRGDVYEVQRTLMSAQSNTRKKLMTMKDTKDISYGHLLVPGSELEITSRAANEPAEYQKAAAMTPTGEIIIFIVGQVIYRFGGDDSLHESGFIFSVSRKGGQWVTLENEVTPAGDIEIKSFGAGFYAT